MKISLMSAYIYPDDSGVKPPNTAICPCHNPSLFMPEDNLGIYIRCRSENYLPPQGFSPTSLHIICILLSYLNTNLLWRLALHVVKRY